MASYWKAKAREMLDRLVEGLGRQVAHPGVQPRPTGKSCFRSVAQRIARVAFYIMGPVQCTLWARRPHVQVLPLRLFSFAWLVTGSPITSVAQIVERPANDNDSGRGAMDLAVQNVEHRSKLAYSS